MRLKLWKKNMNKKFLFFIENLKKEKRLLEKWQIQLSLMSYYKVNKKVWIYQIILVLVKKTILKKQLYFKKT